MKLMNKSMERPIDAQRPESEGRKLQIFWGLGKVKRVRESLCEN
jgi:hypothetical protein